MFATSLVFVALLAQSAPPADPGAKARAQILLKEGASAYDQGDLAGALGKFKQAYSEFPSPKLLLNLGQVHRALGNFPDAMEAFERFLAEATDAPEEMKAEASKATIDLQPKLGRLHIECDTRGAAVTVDGKSAGKSPVSSLIWVLPGKHQVTGRVTALPPALEDVEVGPSMVYNVYLRLQPVAKPSAAAARAQGPAPKLELRVQDGVVKAVPRAPEAPARDEGWWLGRTWTWVAAGSAVILAGSATVVGLSMQSRYDSLKQSCGSASPDWPGCSEGDISALTTRKDVTNVLWGLTGVAAATAGVLFFVEDHRVAVTPVVGQNTGVLARISY